MGLEDLQIVAAEGMMLPGGAERLAQAKRAASAMALGLVAA
jgi:hypothetical protein